MAQGRQEARKALAGCAGECPSPIVPALASKSRRQGHYLVGDRMQPGLNAFCTFPRLRLY